MSDASSSFLASMIYPNILSLIGIPVVFFLGLLGSLTPPLSYKLQKNFDVTDTQIFRILSGFAGGVIVAVALVHSFPEGQELISENLDYEYPFAGLFALLGVFATFTVESIVSHLLRKINKNSEKKISLEIEQSVEIADRVRTEKLPQISKEDSGNISHSSSEESDEDKTDNNQKVEIEMDVMTDIEDKKQGMIDLSKKDEEERNAQAKFYTEMYVLLFGLSFHSVFVGFTLGLSENDIGLFLAILCHQLFEGFALGVRIARANFEKTRSIIGIDIIFASSTSLGIIIGLLVKEIVEKYPETFAVVQGSFNAFSAGILIFVGLVHMIAEEVEREEIVDSPWKFAAIFFGALAGASFMSIIALWA